MEKKHGQDWACLVEPITKFVQCFGVSKRPDQFIRLISGTDRIRVWRLSDVESQKTELEKLNGQFERVKAKLMEESA